MHQEAEGRSDSGKKEDGDNLPAILAILRTIKSSEDAIDKAKTEVCSFSVLHKKEMGVFLQISFEETLFPLDEFVAGSKVSD